jgi:hypothetical protein
LATIREGIRRNVHHSHDERAFAELQHTGTNIPFEDRAHCTDSKSAIVWAFPTNWIGGTISMPANFPPTV